jgi:hypothetical protein
MNMSNLLITAATNYPDRPAISFNNVTYNWSEVNAQKNLRPN